MVSTLQTNPGHLPEFEAEVEHEEPPVPGPVGRPRNFTKEIVGRGLEFEAEVEHTGPGAGPRNFTKEIVDRGLTVESAKHKRGQQQPSTNTKFLII
jgi:hypothetical protein